MRKNLSEDLQSLWVNQSRRPLPNAWGLWAEEGIAAEVVLLQSVSWKESYELTSNLRLVQVRKAFNSRSSREWGES